MTTDLAEPLVSSRVTVLPIGVRIIRLGQGDEGWLREYEAILRVSAKDFLQRSRLPGTPEGVLKELMQSLEYPSRAVWLVLTAEYRLLGFALAECWSQFGGPLEMVALAVYLYPRRCPREVFPTLVQTMLAWGRSLGAETGGFVTRRQTRHAWTRIGAQPVSTVYTMPTAGLEEISNGR